jgi:predicted nucleotidyltransferase
MDSLLFSTGSSDIDQLLVQVITRFETSFPGSLRACFLAGSYAEGHAIPTSDVDLFIVFKGRFKPGEQEAARTLKNECVQESAIHLELAVGDEVELQEMNRLPLKLSSRLLYGEDIRPHIQLPDMETYIRSSASKVIRYSGPILRRRASLTLPLDYPDPFDEFFGYLQPGDGSKWLTALVGAIATARIAAEARQYVPSRLHCARLYREHIDDDWADLVYQILERCKMEWGYGVPAFPDQRQQLRAYCQATLGLENIFFERKKLCRFLDHPT